MILSLAIWIPVLAGLVVLAAGGDPRAPLQRWIALAGALLGFLVTLPLYTGFDAQSAGFQFQEKLLWIERFSIHYHLGVDGISLLFILLNSFVTILVVIAGWSVIDGVMVNGSARLVGWFAGVVRLIQTGLLNTYAFLILFGILSGLTWVMWRYVR